MKEVGYANKLLSSAKIGVSGIDVGVVGARCTASYHYTSLHALRHFFASWCINRRADGGRELPANVVQEVLAHSSITMTMDTYGHLFPRSDDRKELAAAERLLLGMAEPMGANQ